MAKRKEAETSWPLENAVLLITDVQNDFIKQYPKHKEIVPKARDLAKKCRAAGIPVIHTLFLHSENKATWPRIDAMLDRKICMEGTKGADEAKQLIDEDDYYIRKHMFSAFHETALEELLEDLDAKTIILCGLLTHCCVYATAMDAYQKGFNLIFVKDCISSYRKKLHNELVNGFFRNSLGEVIDSKKLIERIEKECGKHEEVFEEDELEAVQWDQ